MNPRVERMIVTACLVRGDADDAADHWKKLGAHPRVYARSVRAELLGATMYVVVVDRDIVKKIRGEA